LAKVQFSAGVEDDDVGLRFALLLADHSAMKKARVPKIQEIK